jgi:hypothetical protein
MWLTLLGRAAMSLAVMLTSEGLHISVKGTTFCVLMLVPTLNNEFCELPGGHLARRSVSVSATDDVQ